jgi:hypothetical protein
MGKITKMVNDASVRNYVAIELEDVLTKLGAEKVGNALWAIPVVDLRGEDRSATIGITVKKEDYNRGDAADEYTDLVEERKVKAEEKAVAKAKKIKVDAKRRAVMAEKANAEKE